ncbi:hypothetical protein [Nostoc sp.]
MVEDWVSNSIIDYKKIAIALLWLWLKMPETKESQSQDRTPMHCSERQIMGLV